MRPPQHDDDRRFMEDDPRNLRHAPVWGPPPMMRKHLLRHDAFKEMQTLILLTKIEEQSQKSEEPKGITGSHLQELYDLPRGTLIRTLTALEKSGLITAEKAVINERANKLYRITEKGREHLDGLRQKWAARGELIDELAPFERYGRPWFGRTRPIDRHISRGMHRVNPPGPPRHPGHPGPPPAPEDHLHHPLKHRHDPAHIQNDLIEVLLNQSEFIHTKEEAVDFLKGHRSRLNQITHRLSQRLEEAEAARKKVDDLIEKIEKLPDFSTDALEKLFQE